MEVKTIKGIDEGTWMEFKMLAVKKRLTMGKLLRVMIEKYSKDSNEFWDSILNGDKILTDKDAKAIHKYSRELRKERGFRDVPNI
ncbi:hypothetical protein HYW75_05730 [Candidatus Pacearchaeota archaeon]|nr:hypothetical protein [Candidatus Pacearchaeota archaeon]